VNLGGKSKLKNWFQRKKFGEKGEIVIVDDGKFDRFWERERERERNGFNLCRKRKQTRATRLIKYLWLAFIDAWVDRVACGGSILARVSLGNTPSSPFKFKFDGWRTFLAGYLMGIWFCNWVWACSWAWIWSGYMWIQKNKMWSML
jgi:hypothetical protein